MRHLGQEALRIDTTGLPLEWIDYKDAVRLYAVDQVVYHWALIYIRFLVESTRLQEKEAKSASIQSLQPMAGRSISKTK